MKQTWLEKVNDTNLNKEDDLNIRYPNSVSSRDKPKRFSLKGAVDKSKLPHKKTEKSEPIQEKKTLSDPTSGTKNTRNHVILGIGMLLAVVSIAYSTSVILIGIDSVGSKIALIPQVALGLYILIKAFSILRK